MRLRFAVAIITVFMLSVPIAHAVWYNPFTWFTGSSDNGDVKELPPGAVPGEWTPPDDEHYVVSYNGQPYWVPKTSDTGVISVPTTGTSTEKDTEWVPCPTGPTTPTPSGPTQPTGPTTPGGAPSQPTPSKDTEWVPCPTGPTAPTPTTPSPTGPSGGPSQPTPSKDTEWVPCPTGPTAPTQPAGPTTPSPTGPGAPSGKPTKDTEWVPCPTGPTPPGGPSGPTAPTGPKPTGPTTPGGAPSEPTPKKDSDWVPCPIAPTAPTTTPTPTTTPAAPTAPTQPTTETPSGPTTPTAPTETGGSTTISISYDLIKDAIADEISNTLYGFTSDTDIFWPYEPGTFDFPAYPGYGPIDIPGTSTGETWIYTAPGEPSYTPEKWQPSGTTETTPTKYVLDTGVWMPVPDTEAPSYYPTSPLSGTPVNTPYPGRPHKAVTEPSSGGTISAEPYPVGTGGGFGEPTVEYPTGGTETAPTFGSTGHASSSGTSTGKAVGGFAYGSILYWE